MANLKELVEETKTVKSSKTKAKPKTGMSFTAGTPVAKKSKTVIKDEYSSIDQEVVDGIIAGEPISAEKETKTVNKEPNLVKQLDEVKTVPAVKEVSLPVEEQEVLARNLAKTKPKYEHKSNIVEEPKDVQPLTKKPVHNHSKPVHNNNKNTLKISKESGPKPSNKELPPAAGLYPDHMVELVLIVKNNAQIRRFTALGILNHLLQKGEIKNDKRYVAFKWNKFTVRVGINNDIISKDYYYTEDFFLNALAASFASFAALSQKVIDNFIYIETNKRFEDVASNDGIAKMFDSTQGH